MSKPVELTHVVKQYSGSGWFRKAPAKTVLNGVSFAIGEQEIVGLVGESGSGKTTLAKLVLGLEPYQNGSVKIDGKELNQLTAVQLKQLRRQVQVIFQDPYSSLDPRMTVRQIITEPWTIHGLYPDRKQREQVLRELLQSVGLDMGMASRYPHEFSGGQRQRIAIARALALQPRILVADEPVSALDVSVQAQILNLLKEISCRQKLSMLFISHDFAVARFLCDRLAVMYKGYIVESGPTEAVLTNPQHPYTESLLSAVPIPNPALQKQRVAIPVVQRNLTPIPACPYAERCPYFQPEVCGKFLMENKSEKGRTCLCVRFPFQNTKSRYAMQGDTK